MGIIRSIAKNILAVMIGNIFDTLLNLIISISLAKYFGQNGFGKVSFLATFFFFLGSMDNQWIRPILVRQISRSEENSARIIGNGLIIKGLISILAIILFWIVIWSVHPSSEIVILSFFTSIGLLMASVISSYETVFQAKLKMGYFVSFSLGGKLLTLAFIYIIAQLKGNLFHFYLLSLIPGVILLLQIKHYSDKIIKLKFTLDFELWRMIFKESWPLGLTALFIFIYHRLDQIILFRLQGPNIAGLYSASTRLTETFTIVPVALMASLLPLMSESYQVSLDNFKKMYELAFKYLLVFIIPVAVGLTIFSDQATIVFYGKEFLPSSLATRILIWAEVFVFVGIVNNTILISSNKQKIDPVFTGTSAAVNIVLNVILIPKYSFIGAAIASLISYAVGPVMGYFIPSTTAYSRSMLIFSLRPLLASLLMAYCISCMHNYFLASIFISPLIYFSALYFLRGITVEDIGIIKSIALGKNHK